MDNKIKESINRLRELKEILGKFSAKKDAVEYLIKETNLSEEECSKAYDFLMNLDLDKKVIY